MKTRNSSDGKIQMIYIKANAAKSMEFCTCIHMMWVDELIFGATSLNKCYCKSVSAHWVLGAIGGFDGVQLAFENKQTSRSESNNNYICDTIT